MSTCERCSVVVGPKYQCPKCKQWLTYLPADVVKAVVGDLRSLLETGPRDGYDLGIEDVIEKLEAE